MFQRKPEITERCCRAVIDAPIRFAVEFSVFLMGFSLTRSPCGVGRRNPDDGRLCVATARYGMGYSTNSSTPSLGKSVFIANYPLIFHLGLWGFQV